MREQCLTWRISSKSRAASFFNSDMLFANLRIVSLPKLGTWRNLGRDLVRTVVTLTHDREITVDPECAPDRDLLH